MSANDGGPHYYRWGDGKLQTWDYITSHNLGYIEGCVIKYVTRWKHKNGVEDLRKAKHCLTKLIELQEGCEDTVATANSRPNLDEEYQTEIAWKSPAS